MKKMYKYLLYILPAVLYFSYYPLIKLGENETMYFELSLPLLWLVAFDVVAFALLFKEKRKVVLKKILGGITWWLFPLFVLFSSFWSLNPVRGILTSGVLWLVMLAVAEIYELREYLDVRFFRVFLKWFFGAGLLVCGWCALQCILDIAGISQEVTLMCDGCTYKMFGFPHPNGFAIEPQFMGNLLLAPVMVAAYGYFQKRDWRYLGLFAIFAVALFLTFSRGAIYAGAVGLIFLAFFMYFRTKKTERGQVFKNILCTVGAFIASFVFALNLQGMMAASSPTTDTYFDGVAKVLNHLSLGVIDVRGTGVAENQTALLSGAEVVENSEITEGKMDFVENVVVENFEDEGEKTDNGQEAIFDGYVAESTDTRVRLASAALTVWRKDFKTVAFGVGIGGAGQALYDNGLSPAPREIVQNEYASLLLETGLVGVSLFVVLMVLILRTIFKTKTAGLMLCLMIAYGISLLFFSGLPNALQIILLPGVLIYLQLPPRLVRRRNP